MISNQNATPFGFKERKLIETTIERFGMLSALTRQTTWFRVLACFCLSAMPIQASDPLFAPPLQVELGPEQIIAPGAGWPYLFQSREGTTVVLGHVKWVPKSPYPIHFTVRSFDGRKTWEPGNLGHLRQSRVLDP